MMLIKGCLQRSNIYCNKWSRIRHLSSWRRPTRQTFVSRNPISIFRTYLNSIDPHHLVYAIIGLNVTVYGMWNLADSNRYYHKLMMDHFSVSYFGIFKRYRIHTLFSSFFSHLDTGHLLVNMFMLWMFGPEIALILGVQRFLVLYTGSGLISSCCHILSPFILPSTFPSSRKSFQSKYMPALGASGAINGLVAYYVLTFPSRIIWLYFIIPVPAALAGLLFIMKDTYGLYKGDSNIGNAAHLGGAAFGLAYFLKSRIRFI